MFEGLKVQEKIVRRFLISLQLKSAPKIGAYYNIGVLGVNRPLRFSN